MSAFLLLLAVILLTLQWIYNHFQTRYKFWKERNVPYLEPRFPVGNVSETLQSKVHFAYIMKKLYDQLKHHGDYVGIFFFRDPVLMVLSPEFAKTVLVKDFNYFIDRGVYSNEKDDPLSANLFFMEGHRWRKLRAKLTPTFTSGRLKAMFHTILSVGQQFDRYLGEYTKGRDEVEIKDLLARFTTDIIGTCAFGIDCNSLENPQSKFREMGRRMINFPKLKALKLFFAMMFRNAARKLGVRFNDEDVSEFFLAVVRETIEFREKNNVQRKDFMQLLIDLNNKGFIDADSDGHREESGTDRLEKLTFEEIAAQAFVFFFAGFETSATTMTCALYLLATHPEIQDKGRRCVIEVLSKHQGNFTYEALAEMNYIDCIIHETLRMYPPVATLHRITSKPYKLPNGSILPKGTGVLIPNLAFQHDPENFPEPLQFRPERFMEGEKEKHHHFSYLAFGEGPRICIGMRFGLLQSKMGIALLLRSYRFRTCSKTAIPLEIDTVALIQGPAGEVWLGIDKIFESVLIISLVQQSCSSFLSNRFEMWIYLLITVISLAIWYVRKKFSYWESRDVPFIKPRFPFGNLQAIGRRVHSSQLMTRFYREMKGKHPFGGIFFFTNPVALALDLEFVKNVLVRDFQYFHDRGMYYNEKDDPISGHLFNIEGTKWTNLRKKLIPTFSSGKMKMMCPTIVTVAERFRDCVEKSIGMHSEVEMKDLLARFTTDVIGTCAFGIDCNSLNDPDAEFRKMGKKVFELPSGRILKFFFMATFKELAKKVHIKGTEDDVSAFFFKVVQETIEYREKNNVQRNDFMNLLIQLKQKGELDESGENVGTLSLNEVVAQAFVFFLGGFETSSTTMSYCLYELSLNEDIQDKARQCVKDAVAKHGGLNYDAVMDMDYIEQCINESLRKYPPGANLIRSVTKDYLVPDTDTIFKKGMSVMIPVYAIHHDAEYYPDPERYDPERFSIDESAKRKPFTFMPFGEGPRICIAARFGLLETKIGLATLLLNFSFSRCSKSVVPLVISPKHAVLTPAGGLWLKVDKLLS
ncbi:uncharacterized protein LOC131429329 [Malaya genurostris]|uniref:uncharacterized protein LOC131429329 n=1 Tax=Malaya genurostris TaxID=325434 RepID=UPI0026F40206|nr:uncharacterized protein LOC131429329 [Malaya genurostris]